MEFIKGASNGTTVQISANLTWSYPLLPGEPPNVLRSKFAACVPSNVTLASACCSAAGGTYILQNLNNERLYNSSELKTILDTKYPNRNNTSPGIGGAPTINGSWYTGDFITAPNATSSAGYNWCSLPYSPLSSTRLDSFVTNQTSVGGFQSGDFYGNTPESVLKWIQCYKDSSPQASIAAGRVAYACGVDDVRSGGTIEGYKRFNAVGGAETMVHVPTRAGVLSTVAALSGVGYLFISLVLV